MFTKAQEALIEKHRDINTDHDWYESTTELFKADMALIGIEVEKTYFSGFWSQGDGACFEGRVSDWPLYLASIGRADNLVLVEFLTDSWTFSVSHSGHYYHENCTHFSGDNPTPDDASDEWFIEVYAPSSYSEFRAAAWLAVLRAVDFTALHQTMVDNFKDHMRGLYKRLEAEYEYLTCDDVVWESIVANELDQDIDEEIEA